MKRVFFLLACLMVLRNAKADFGFASLQAVCEVKTMEGKIYEGYILLIAGGDPAIFPNGFFFYKDDHYNSTKFFGETFDDLVRKNDDHYKMGRFSGDAKEVYFLDYNPSIGSNQLKKSKKRKYDSLGMYLEITSFKSVNYRLLNYIPLYTKLPRHLELSSSNPDMIEHKIALTDIASFKLLKTPDQKWLDEIALRTMEYMKTFLSLDSIDWQGPIWFHELIKTKGNLEAWQKQFDYLFYKR